MIHGSFNATLWLPVTRDRYFCGVLYSRNFQELLATWWNVTPRCETWYTMSACANNSVRGRECPQRGRNFEDDISNFLSPTSGPYSVLLFSHVPQVGLATGGSSTAGWDRAG